MIKQKDILKKISTHGNKLNKIKNEISKIRINWKNNKIKIITDEIRKSVKNGDSKMVWRRINQLKHNKNNTFEKTILRKKNGKLTCNDDEVLIEMKNNLIENSHTTKREIKKKIISNDTWNNSDWNNDLDNIDIEIETRRKKIVYQQKKTRKIEKKRVHRKMFPLAAY